MYGCVVMNIKDKYQKLIAELMNCRLCQEKFGFEPHPVVFGNMNAKIVQISQAPSATVDRTRKPFTDISGKRLKYDWYKIDDLVFYNPDNFYIVSLAHCYPGKNSSGNDRLPPKECFNKWVSKELEFINNKLYVIIGAKAAKVFFPNDNFNDLVFENNSINGKMAIVLPHPSPLNIKWFKDHPEFMERRIFEVRNIINEVLKK